MSKTKSYDWQEIYENEWKSVDTSNYCSIIDTIENERRRKLLSKPVNKRLGLMRFVIFFIDMSEAMKIVDLKPTRLDLVLKNAVEFVEQFFDQNPISQLCICGVKNGEVIEFSSLSGNQSLHLDCLKKLFTHCDISGDFSLENILRYSRCNLKHVPKYASREIIIAMASLSSIDQHNIHEIIEDVHNDNIRCSVLSLTSEVFLFKKLAKETGGLYNVLLDETDMKYNIQNLVPPLPSFKTTDAAMIPVGFPTQLLMNNVFCSCHTKLTSDKSWSYECPRCSSIYCSLPIECISCGLMLVSALHLARSYHHLFPLADFSQTFSKKNDPASMKCSGCNLLFKQEQSIFKCDECNHLYCDSCNEFLHNFVHICPNCTNGMKSNTF